MATTNPTYDHAAVSPPAAPMQPANTYQQGIQHGGSAPHSPAQSPPAHDIQHALPPTYEQAANTTKAAPMDAHPQQQQHQQQQQNWNAMGPGGMGVTPLNMLGDSPQYIDCPFCHQRSTTVVSREGTSMQIVVGAVLCLFCICLACVPCMAGWFEDTEYRCANCKNMVAVRRHDGPVEVYGPNQAVQSQYAGHQAPMQMGNKVVDPQQQQQQHQQQQQQQQQQVGQQMPQQQVQPQQYTDQQQPQHTGQQQQIQPQYSGQQQYQQPQYTGQQYQQPAHELQPMPQETQPAPEK